MDEPLEIDPGRTALALLDCQNDVVHPEGAIARAMGFGTEVLRTGLVERAGALVAAARDRDIAVIHVRIDTRKRSHVRDPGRGHFFRRRRAAAERAPLEPGSWGAAFHEDLAPQRGEAVVDKYPIGAFANSGFAELLRAHGIEELILAGVSTHMVVLNTARTAADLGHEVIVAGDASCAGSEAQHRAALEMIEVVADVASTHAILDALARR